MQYIQLNITALKQMGNGIDKGVVLLSDANHHVYPIICEMEEAMNIQMTMEDYDAVSPPYFSQTIAQTYKDLGVKCDIFLSFGDETPTAILRLNGNSDKCYEMYWVDALCLSLNEGVEVYAEMKHWRSISQRFYGDSAKIAFEIPTEQLPDTVLQTMMEEAVKQENYEGAQKLKDILDKRN